MEFQKIFMKNCTRNLAPARITTLLLNVLCLKAIAISFVEIPDKYCFVVSAIHAGLVVKYNDEPILGGIA
jgi:uncharacterized membrane protein